MFAELLYKKIDKSPVFPIFMHTEAKYLVTCVNKTVDFALRLFLNRRQVHWAFNFEYFINPVIERVRKNLILVNFFFQFIESRAQHRKILKISRIVWY